MVPAGIGPDRTQGMGCRRSEQETAEDNIREYGLRLDCEVPTVEIDRRFVLYDK